MRSGSVHASSTITFGEVFARHGATWARAVSLHGTTSTLRQNEANGKRLSTRAARSCPLRAAVARYQSTAGCRKSHLAHIFDLDDDPGCGCRHRRVLVRSSRAMWRDQTVPGNERRLRPVLYVLPVLTGLAGPIAGSLCLTRESRGPSAPPGPDQIGRTGGSCVSGQRPGHCGDAQRPLHRRGSHRGSEMDLIQAERRRDSLFRAGRRQDRSEFAAGRRADGRLSDPGQWDSSISTRRI